MTDPDLRIYTEIPAGFLTADATELHSVIEGPSLIHLRGRREPPLFVSVLLHGNELTGLHAIQALLTKYGSQDLPRSLSLFVGNVEAARHGVRRLDGQPDYNRVWPGGHFEPSPESKLMQQVVDEMLARGAFASVDVHNNTGMNPHYACVNRVDDRFFHLATLFGRTVVYFTQPEGVQSAAFARHWPSVTLECGQSGEPNSLQHALDYLDACLHLAEIPTHPIADHDMDLFHTVAIVKIPEGASFSFDDPSSDILFDKNIDHLNFRELTEGTRFGQVKPGSQVRMHVTDNEGREVGEGFFRYEDNKIRLHKRVMPSMLTLDERAIRQDCLCYLMERYSYR